MYTPLPYVKHSLPNPSVVLRLPFTVVRQPQVHNLLGDSGNLGELLGQWKLPGAPFTNMV